MPQEISPIIILFISVILIWLMVLSYFLRKTMLHYNRLGKGVTKQNLSTLLEKILVDLELSKKDIQKIVARCDNIEEEGLRHTQKIGLLRFNPFADTGGDQSFILAILNGREDGILISSLHGRAGTRWFAKSVRAGKGVEHELSNEEKTAIKQAKPV